MPFSVLVVEDEKTTAMLFKESLQRAYKITLAGSMGEGLEKLPGQHAVLLDVYLPNGQGCAVIRRFKAAAPTIPIVAMSSKDISEQEAKEAGAAVFIRKPPENIAVVIGSLLMVITDNPEFDPASAAAEFAPVKDKLARAKESTTESLSKIDMMLQSK